MTCALVWRSGGTVVGADFETMLSLTNTAGLDQMIAELLANTVFALTDAVLLLFAFLYFRSEQTHGTPFTHRGACKIKKLGVKVIVLPLVAAILSVVIYGCFGLPSSGDRGYGTAVVLGIMLILASLVFRYGAELEANAKETSEQTAAER